MTRWLASLLLIAALTGAATADVRLQTEQDADRPPRTIGLLERSGKRLTQVDITVLGPPERVASLTAEDLSIKVNFRRLTEFTLDRMCGPDATAPDGATDDAGTLPPAVRSRTGTPPSLLFYFDQPHLTLGGRQSAITVARQLVEELIHDGAQGMIVSNASELKIVEPLTSDPARLLAAIERQQRDRDQWDIYAQQEDSRVAEVIKTLNEPNEYNGIGRAIGMARRFQMEETWRAEKSMRRLGMTLKRLSEVSPPKAVVLFADTLRSNAGAHYLSFFGESLRRAQMPLMSIGTDALMAQLPFDKIVNEAAVQGVRFYPYLSQGLTSTFGSNLPSAQAFNATGGNPSGSRARFHQAQDTLANLATETGGLAFLAGQGAGRIAARVREDLTCLYIASFDPEGYPEDQPLRVVVESSHPELELRTRGRVVVESPSARATSRLLSAFASPDVDSGDPLAVRAGVVPTGFVNGSYTALLQISVPATPLQSATWDLGASVVTREKVEKETSGRLSVTQPGVPVVFETELRFKPGAYEIVSVAHETATGLISSEQVEVDWPEPKTAATVTPIAVLQPENGAFLRSDASRNTGSLAQGKRYPIRTDRPTALVGLVCRNKNKRNRSGLAVERTLVGASTVEFPPLALDLGDERCAQIRDLVPRDTMGEGYYRYDVRVVDGDATLSTGSREFIAVAPPG